MTEREKSYAEMLYQPADPELAADRDVTVQKLYEYNRLHPLDRQARAAAIRGLFGSVGENCVVEQPLFCTYGYNVTVGDNFFMNVNGRLMDSGKITIGNNVFIAPDVCIITEEHAMDAAQRAAGLEYTPPGHHRRQCLDRRGRAGAARRDDRGRQRDRRRQRRHQGTCPRTALPSATPAG